jgi:hypothetical protein
MPVLNQLLMAALAVLSVAVVSGCTTDQYQYEYPTSQYRPTIVGVIESGGLGGSLDWRVTLADGRTLDLSSRGSVLGTKPLEGYLLLRGTTAGGDWWGALEALDDGCWEAYEGPSSNPIVWDLGSSILFTGGLELPKAAGFWSAVQPEMIDGRLGWLQPRGDVFTTKVPTSFCANARGEVEFAVLKWTGQRPSPPPSA